MKNVNYKTIVALLIFTVASIVCGYYFTIRPYKTSTLVGEKFIAVIADDNAFNSYFKIIGIIALISILIGGVMLILKFFFEFKSNVMIGYTLIVCISTILCLIGYAKKIISMHSLSVGDFLSYLVHLLI